MRRGDSYLADPRKYAEVVHNMELLRVSWQHILAKECKAVAYDNLAIEQLGPKDELCIPDSKYAHLYQGNDTECFDADGNIRSFFCYFMAVMLFSLSPVCAGAIIYKAWGKHEEH